MRGLNEEGDCGSNSGADAGEGSMTYTVQEDIRFLGQVEALRVLKPKCSEASFEVRCDCGHPSFQYTSAEYAANKLFVHSRVHDEDDSDRGTGTPRPYLSYFAT